MLTANSDCTVKKEIGEEGGQNEERDHISLTVTKNICLFLQDHKVINTSPSLKIQTRTVGNNLLKKGCNKITINSSLLC